MARMRGVPLRRDLRALLSDLILGLASPPEEYKDEELIEHASKGFFHALAAASTIASQKNRRVLLCVLDKDYNGVAIAVDPSRKEGERVEVCRIEIAFPVECTRNPSKIEWPNVSDIVKVCFYLL